MGRLLALDLGEKRIGLAISDEGHSIAQILEPAFQNNASFFRRMKKLIRDFQIEKVLIGLPTSLSGESGPAAEKTVRYVKKIQEDFKVPVELLDERFSSMQAQKILKSERSGRNKAKNLIDNLSAQLVLQAYLDNLRSKFTNENKN